MRNIVKTLGIGLACLGSVYGFDYKIDANVSQVTRIGLSNNYKIDVDKGIYPNNSFALFSSQLGATINLLETDEHRVRFGIRGILAAVGLDTTSGSKILPTDYNGIDSNGVFIRAYTPAFAELINAYLSYDYKDYFGIIGGRYSFGAPDEVMGTDWWSGHNQGVRIYGGIDNWKAYFIYVHTRSSSNLEKINHFDPQNRSVDKFGAFVLGVDGNIDINENNNLFVRPYLYYQPGAYIDPGFKVVHTIKNVGQRFDIKTTLLMLFAIHEKRAQNVLSDYDWGFNSLVVNGQYLGRTHGKGGTALFLRSDVSYDNQHFGGGIYKNFGNPNDMIGSYGDPTGLNTWVYTAYSTGPTWSDFFSHDAFNIFALYGQKFDKWSYEVVGRYLFSPRSNENSIALLVNYDVSKNLNVYVRLEWAGTLNKPGFKLVETFLTKNVYTDKSMIFWYITAKL